MTFKVNTVDLTPYIACDGLKWQRNDIDGPNAGRTQNGDMVRDRVATKIRWDMTCRALTGDELRVVLGAVADEFLQVTYSDPETGTVKTGTFYSGSAPASLLSVKRNGVEYWTGVTIPIIQR